MKKKLLAALISAIIVMSVFACVCSVSAIDDFAVADIAETVKVCPGTVLPLEAPKVFGDAGASKGWEIKTSEDGDWLPYDGSAFAEYSAPGVSQVVWVRYFAYNADGTVKVTSTECEVTVAHTPQGGYEKDALYHWRVCAECDGKCDMEAHTTIGGEGDKEPEANKDTCTVCGSQRSYHFSFTLKFMDWIAAVIQAIMNLF